MSATKDCKFCDKRGLLWLPLRYGVVGAPALSDLALLPKLSGKLGKGVTDIALTHAKYAVRLLRPGYLYVLIERKGIKYWEAYRVLEDAFLYKFKPEEPPQTEPTFSCERHTCGINASMVAIPEANEVPKVWSLFVAAPLTKATLNDYRDNAAKYVEAGKLQTFSPAAWLQGNTAQAHTLLAPELLTAVAEFILFTQPGNPHATDLGKALELQCFPASNDAYAGVPPDGQGNYFGRLGGLFNTIKRAGYASFVLHDHIGLTQELNDFRNAALTPIQAFLAKRDGEIDNQRRLEVMNAIEDIRAGVKAHVVSLNAQQIQNVDQMNLPNHQANTARQLRAMGRTAEAEKIEADIKLHEARKAKNREALLDGTDAERRWQRIYGDLIDEREIDRFRKALEAESARCGQQANLRAPDHLRWVKATRLVDAFDVFDPQDQSSGFVFTHEHMLCTHGMFGIEANQAVLAGWMNIDSVERSNLYMRANLYNHQDLIAQASLTFAAVRREVQLVSSVEYIAVDKLAKFTKGMVDAFKKADSAWDEWLRDEVVKELQAPGTNAEKKKLLEEQGKLRGEPAKETYRRRMTDLAKYHRHPEGLKLARIAEWTRGVTSKGGKLDKGITAVVGFMLYPRLGALTEKIGMQSFLLKLSKENLAAIQTETQRAVAQGRMTPQQGEAHVKNYDKGGQYQDATYEAARREGAAQAKVVAKAEATKVKGSLEVLLRDEQAKLRERIALTLNELDAVERPSTNNFRQMRMGVLMMSLETLALVSKLEQHSGDWTTRGRLEIIGSLTSLASMSLDLIYAAGKSVRELAAFSSKATPNLNAAANIMRGGLKLAAGTLSTGAGMISVVLDAQAALGEAYKKNTDRILLSVYAAKSTVGAINAALGFIAAFSYTGPMFKYLGLTKLALSAERVATIRTIWLIRVARFNMIGLTLTAAELGYTWWIKDDELQAWCKSCTFRLDKNTRGIFAKTPYANTQQELEALQKAFLIVTGQGA